MPANIPVYCTPADTTATWPCCWGPPRRLPKDGGLTALSTRSFSQPKRPNMGSEDFTYMPQACPGRYFFIGTRSGPKDKPLHHPAYDFNDAILPVGAGFWTHLTEAFLAAVV